MKKLILLLLLCSSLKAQTVATAFLKFSGDINRTNVHNYTGLIYDSTTYIPNANGSVTNANLAGSIDLTTKVTGQLPNANGGNAGSAATSATTGAMTVNMTSSVITITPTNACTFNGSGGTTGALATFVITTSGASSFVLTWGTNFKTTATLATGTTTAKKFCVTFRCIDGTNWIEISRTTAQ